MAHRDLKPDNILFSKDEYDIKVTDFGFLIPLEGRDRNAWLQSRVGTLTYMAPEVIAREPYQGKAADIYSLGVILFILLLGNMPMEQATVDDKFFKCLQSNRVDLFWQTHQKTLPGVEIPEDFKELITMMICPEQSMRIDLGDIICHPWMQGEMATKEEIIEEMERRRAASKAMAEQSRAGEGARAGARRDFQLGELTYVTELLPEHADNANIRKLDVKQADEDDDLTMSLLTTRQPDQVFADLTEYLRENKDIKMEAEIKDGQWKLESTFTRDIKLTFDDDEDEEEKKEEDDSTDNSFSEVAKLVFEVVSSEDKNYMTVRKKSGSFLLFQRIWKDLQANLVLQE